MYIYIYICKYIYIHIYVYLYTHIYVCIHVLGADDHMCHFCCADYYTYYSCACHIVCIDQDIHTHVLRIRIMSCTSFYMYQCIYIHLFIYMYEWYVYSQYVCAFLNTCAHTIVWKGTRVHLHICLFFRSIFMITWLFLVYV